MSLDVADKISTEMKKRGIIHPTFLVILTGCFVLGGHRAGNAGRIDVDPWQIAHPFGKRLDAGATSAPIDPQKPPTLAIWLLSGGSGDLHASADYFKLTPGDVTLHGRMVKGSHGDARRFYPYARLEVSNTTNSGWCVIGRSPAADVGVKASATMMPIKIGVANPEAKFNAECMIDMNPFRPMVGKFRYGRVVLQNGGSSQILVLTDLLPPKDAIR